ncbi:MAG: hypothetical protein HKO13_09395 [Sphingomonas sp.]|nr:hypothetical protein [Sphingomonas sp.]
MMGLFLFAVAAMLVVITLWLLGVRQAWLTYAAAALSLGGAGYAIYGSPGQAGAPREATQNVRAPMSLDGARQTFFGRFNTAEQWATMASAYAGRGDTRSAAGVMKSAVREHPRNFALWTLYGNALADHGGGYTPAARLAYARAEALAGDTHPGPRFFRALAQARSGEPRLAIETWRDLLENSEMGDDMRQITMLSIAAYAPMLGSEEVQDIQAQSTGS